MALPLTSHATARRHWRGCNRDRRDAQHPGQPLDKFTPVGVERGKPPVPGGIGHGLGMISGDEGARQLVTFVQARDLEFQDQIAAQLVVLPGNNPDQPISCSRPAISSRPRSVGPYPWSPQAHRKGPGPGSKPVSLCAGSGSQVLAV